MKRDLLTYYSEKRPTDRPITVKRDLLTQAHTTKKKRIPTFSHTPHYVKRDITVKRDLLTQAHTTKKKRIPTCVSEKRPTDLLQ